MNCLLTITQLCYHQQEELYFLSGLLLALGAILLPLKEEAVEQKCRAYMQVWVQLAWD